MNVYHSLVDPHLEPVPGLGAFSARTLAGGDLQNLCRNADWASSLIVVVLCSGHDFGASPLESLDLFASDGQPTTS